MKRLLLAALPVAIMSSFQAQAVDTKKGLPIEPKIVGGEVAVKNQWPWMSAIVATFNEIDTSLSVAGTNFETRPFTNSPAGMVSGEIVDCGIGDASCADASEKVCLIERGEINFSEKALNCEAGGGIGAIVYNNAEGSISGTLGDDFTGSIPVVAISQADGQTLLNQIGDVAEMEVAATESLAQDSSCGASFLGDRWVLTAAHCVDSSISHLMKVNVGEFDLSDGADKAISIERIYMHPLYDDGSLNNDIALIELSEPVEAQAVSLANVETTLDFAQQAALATVIGWGGRLGYAPGQGPTGDFPDVLHQVDLNLMTNAQCAQTYADTYNISPENVGITDKMLCAAVAGGGKSSCQGDSGGPLVVNTNEGWQQVGIVSWGRGCAAEGNPGVFARVAEFSQWRAEIIEGVAITQKVDYGYVGDDEVLNAELLLVNNATSQANISLEIDGSDEIVINDNSCDVINSASTCDVEITASFKEAGILDAYLKISSDNAELLTSESRIVAHILANSTEIQQLFNTNEAEVKFYTGGSSNWSTNITAGSISSGETLDGEETVLKATVQGKGTLSFEWSVSSEENTNDPSDPYDSLYLYVNGQEIEFISGEVNFTEVEISLEQDVSIIEWIYRKDANTSAGDDKGYIRNVSFEKTPEPTLPAPTTPTTPATPASSSGGGSMAWLSLFALGLLRLRKSNA